MQEEKKDLNEAKNCIKNFFKTVNIEVKELKDYDFRKLYNEKFNKFRLKDSKYNLIDKDSFYLTRCINFILWHDKLPNMSTLNEMNDNYGGETINNFYTTIVEGYDTKYKDLFNNKNIKKNKRI